MTPPASAARALHDLIVEVDSRAARRSAYHAWGEVAGVKVDSADFARFHSEAMVLVQNVAESLQALDPSRREKYSGYLPQWWDALVRPRVDWASQGQQIIDEAPLHMLAALADLLESRAEVLAPRNPQTAEMLERAVQHLLGEVEGLTDLPEPVRVQIKADLQHIAWLLQNVDTFGVDHVVEAVERTAGRVVVEATKASSAPSLKMFGIKLVAALAMVASLTDSVVQITEDVRSIFGIEAHAEGGDGDAIQQTVVEIHSACTVPQLTTGPASPDGEPVDAEIVEEPAP